MSNHYQQYAQKFDALSVRERALVVITLLVIVMYLWWYFFAMQELEKIKVLAQQNTAMEAEIRMLDTTSGQIALRIKEGVNKSRQQQLDLLESELDRVKALLQQKTLELIEPDDMFQLMQQMIFKESKLKLIGLKRKLVRPAFEPDPQDEQKDVQQPEIYRHVMQVSFQGSYQNILRYIQSLETLEWKLIWDKITLELGDYPNINVEIEISTLSDSQHWVGL
jgi:MSHA biogenesis protein MshJ